MTYTLNTTIDLQQVSSYKVKDSSGMEKENYAFASSIQTRIDDYAGRDRIISIRGVAYFDSQANLMNNFVVPIRTLQKVSPQPAVELHSDLEDTATSGDYQTGIIYVKIENFEFEHINDGGTTKINYTLELWEGQ